MKDNTRDRTEKKWSAGLSRWTLKLPVIRIREMWWLASIEKKELKSSRNIEYGLEKVDEGR